jgi:hypothetical protein
MKKASPILDYFKEITIVVIGVLIAVSIGNFKERVDNEKYIEKTLLAIENDIKLSQSDLDTVFNRHFELFEILRPMVEGSEPIDPELTLYRLLTDFGGFQVAITKNVSLRFFINNRADLLDYNVISQLLDIESQSSLLQEKIRRLSDFINEDMDKGGQEVFSKFAIYLNDILDSENSLLESYSEFLKHKQNKSEDKSE